MPILINFIDIISLLILETTNQVQMVPISINYIDIISLLISRRTNKV
jgi:hypothetical protein